MVKHTQTIRRQKPANCFSVFDHFMGLALKPIKYTLICLYIFLLHDLFIPEAYSKPCQASRMKVFSKSI